MTRSLPTEGPCTRRGVALLTVMMTLVLIAAMSAAIRTGTGAQLRAIESDIVRTKARWQAEGCASVGLAILNSAQAASGALVWNALDSVLTTAGVPDIVRGCELSVMATGRALGLAQHDEASFTRLLTVSGIMPARADSLTAALFDWMDQNHLPRDGGAESDWYLGEHRPTPRNDVLRSISELAQIRGFDTPGFLTDTLLPLVSVDSTRVAAHRAPFAVLRSIPGMSDADAAAIHRTGTVISGLSLETATPGVSRPVSQLLTEVPDAWELVARISSVSGNALATRRLWLGRTQTRIAVLRVEETP